MEEIYANIEYPKPVESNPSTPHTGKTVQLITDDVHYLHTVTALTYADWYTVCSGSKGSKSKLYACVLLCLGLLTGFITISVFCEWFSSMHILKDKLEQMSTSRLVMKWFYCFSMIPPYSLINQFELFLVFNV